MEYESRFYYPKQCLNQIISLLEEKHELTKGMRTYEKTTQFNHCDPRYDFYSKETDGRFRLRISCNDKESKCKLSWKRRLPNTIETSINKEEEKEVKIDYNELDNFTYIIINVMKFQIVESYERYRTIFTDDDVEIAVDEYPFGIALEIENISKTKNPEKVVKQWADKLGLNLSNSYRLSWDDKYRELCTEQNIEIFNEVTFDRKMPYIKE